MEAKIPHLLALLESIVENNAQVRHAGRPKKYSDVSMLLFFIVMMLKRNHHFKTMEKYAQCHYHHYGWSQAPDRKTLRRRFEQMPNVLAWLLPCIAIYGAKMCWKVFSFRWVFADKSLFNAFGGVWHQKQMEANQVPHSDIDTQGTWGYSPYHKWRFGYGLHLICNQYRFPVYACVTTASVKDHTQLENLIKPLTHYIGMVIGDAGYFAREVLSHLLEKYNIFGYCNKLFKNLTKNSLFEHYYNEMVATAQAQYLYFKRKSSVEPAFSLIKNIFDLENQKRLPYKGLQRVSAYLMITVATVQLLMISNHINKKPLGDTELVCQILK